jgi:hypothetical protein
VDDLVAGGSMLDRAQRALGRWRREHGGPGRLIPEALWRDAVRAAQVHGVERTARALRVDRYRLARRVNEAPPEVVRPERGDGVASEKFVEVALSGSCTAGRTVVRLEGRDGERMVVEFGGACSPEIAALLCGFWSRPR